MINLPFPIFNGRIWGGTFEVAQDTKRDPKYVNCRPHCESNWDPFWGFARGKPFRVNLELITRPICNLDTLLIGNGPSLFHLVVTRWFEFIFWFDMHCGHMRAEIITNILVKRLVCSWIRVHKCIVFELSNELQSWKTLDFSRCPFRELALDIRIRKSCTFIFVSASNYRTSDPYVIISAKYSFEKSQHAHT